LRVPIRLIAETASREDDQQQGDRSKGDDVGPPVVKESMGQAVQMRILWEIESQNSVDDIGRAVDEALAWHETFLKRLSSKILP
jgi:hypothetical protein